MSLGEICSSTFVCQLDPCICFGIPDKMDGFSVEEGKKSDCVRILFTKHNRIQF